MALLVLMTPAYAARWQSDDGDLCVTGEGRYIVSGEGDLYISGAGVLRFDKDLVDDIDVVGDYDMSMTRRYVYYSGDFDSLTIDDFEGTLKSMGGGSGYLELHGSGWVKLYGKARDLNVGCDW